MDVVVEEREEGIAVVEVVIEKGGGGGDIWREKVEGEEKTTMTLF